MFDVRCWLFGVFFLLLSASRTSADYHEFEKIPVNGSLGKALLTTAEATLKEFPRLTPENLALSVIDLTKREAPVRADYHGDSPFYPASIIKLFFMVEIFHQQKHSAEIDRALREMIYVSDNDAAAYLLDVMSETTAGPELEGKALDQFIDRRRDINSYFDSLGYQVSAMMKPWSFSPYGRELQLLGGAKKENRNRASANATAALLYWIVSGRAISAEASAAMMSLLERPLDPLRPEENQVKDFLGEALPSGSRLWSKSGETSEVRHDAAYIELPDGRKLIIVAFTSISEEKAVLPAITRHLLAALSGGPCCNGGL